MNDGKIWDGYYLRGNILREKTTDKVYTKRLQKSSSAKWKRFIDVQKPYRWNLKRLNLGKTLDVGCGIGRNLVNLSKDSLGVDHNQHSVGHINRQGLKACTSEEFITSKCYAKRSFDSLLMSHILEHLTVGECKKILKNYLPYITDKVVIICPQEKGFRTGITHVTFLDADDIEKMLAELGLTIVKSYSFPFHRKLGGLFKYNETVVVASKKRHN